MTLRVMPVLVAKRVSVVGEETQSVVRKPRLRAVRNRVGEERRVVAQDGDAAPTVGSANDSQS